MFAKYDEIATEEVNDGVLRKIMLAEGSLMLVEVTFSREGIELPLHDHPHEQVSLIRKGSFEVTLGDETSTLEEGDSFYAAPNVPHGVVPLCDDAVIVDVFSPQREDFLE